MCSKDCCCGKWAFLAYSILGAGIMVASFVIAAVVMMAVSNGLHNGAIYNSPSTDSSAYQNFLSNVPSKTTNNDAASKYYCYYLFNITNLAAVVTASAANKTTPTVLPTAAEIGPYCYTYFDDKFNVQFDANQDRVSWQDYSRKIFQPSLSMYGGSQLSDTTDQFYQPSLMYSAIFANPLSPKFYGQPEYVFRAATSNLLPIIYNEWFNGILAANGLTLLNTTATGSVAGAAYFQTLLGGQYTSTIQAYLASQGIPNVATLRQLFPVIGNQLGRNWTQPGAVYWEYPDWLVSQGSPAGAALTRVQVATMAQVGFKTTLPVSGGLDCTDMSIAVSGAGLCWLKLTVGTIFGFQQTAGFLSSTQITYMKAWITTLAMSGHDSLFTAMGHQGSNFAYLYPGGTFQTTGLIWNSANSWIKQTPASILFEQFHLYGPLLNGLTVGYPPSRLGYLSYFTNYTSQADAALSASTVQVGTGINYIGDVDNLYVINNSTYVATTGANAVWCHQAYDPTYAPNAQYLVQNFLNIAPDATFRQATQDQSTKYSPIYPPARVDTNKYSLTSTVLSDKSFVMDVWVNDIYRHAHMSYAFDVTIKGISCQRYHIASYEFGVIPFFGQYVAGVANYTCPGASGGAMLLTTYPRFNGVDQNGMANLGIDLAPISTPSDSDFLNNGPFGTNYFNAQQLEAFIDMEPISGQIISGSLKEMLSLQIRPWQGAARAAFLTLSPGFASGTPNQRDVAVPVLWLNKIGFLSDKQASTFKSGIYGGQTAAFVVVIVGTIVGGLLFIGFFIAFLLALKNPSYATQTSSTSKSDFALA